MQDQSFQLLLNGVPYVVKASPYSFNTETRFTVSFNGSEDFVFTYDAAVGRYVAIGDESISIPDDLEIAISEKLYQLV
jgi:hypothetical protein